MMHEERAELGRPLMEPDGQDLGMMTLMATDGVSRVLSLYGHLIDNRDWDRLDEVFLRDCVFEIPILDLSCIGLERLTQFMKEHQHPLSHHVTNLVVTVSPLTGREASCLSKFFAPRQDGTWSFGDYSSELEQSPDGWRIRRHVIIVRVYGWPTITDDIGDSASTA